MGFERPARAGSGVRPTHALQADVGTVVLASIRDAVCVCDAAGRITFWNQGAEAMFGIPAGRAIGRCAIALSRRFAPPGSAPMLRAVEAGEAWTGDVVLPPLSGNRGPADSAAAAPDGDRIIDVVTYPIADGPAEASRVYICWDVTLERRTAHADAHLAAIVEQASDAILTVDRECRVLTWNHGAESLIGIPAAEAIGGPCPLACDEGRRQALHEPAFAGGRTVTIPESWLTARDGTVIPVSIAASPIREADGSIGRLSIIARDERLRHEAARAIRFRDAILENTDDAVVATDGDRMVTFWSPGAERLFGIPAQDALGRSADAVMPSRAVGTSQEDVAKRLARGETIRTDVEFDRPDGTAFVGEVTGNLAQAEDGSRVYLAVIRDVTEARRSARDSARLAAIVESAADIIFSTDAQMRITAWNPGAERVLGWPAADIIGRTIAAIVAPDRLPEAMTLRESVLIDLVPSAGELVYLARDGARIPVWVSHAPIREESGVIGVSTIAQDLRGRKTVEDQLRQAQKLDAVGRLASGIAHDFSNLLTAVNGYASLLVADLDGDGPAAENARQILRASERAGELTRSLAGLSSGRGREPQEFEVDSLVLGLADTLHSLLPDAVQLVVDATSKARVRADPTDIEVALVNLVTNAGEAMPDGGRVEVVTRGATLDLAFASEHLGVVPGPHAEIIVRDTGPGLSAEARARLFEPLYTTKPDGEGTGMGLAMVYASVERAGGTVWVDPGSSGRTGATFRMYLPVVPGTPIVEPEAPRRTLTGNERILVVEDDTQVRALATTILSRAGYLLTVRGDPRRAQEVDPAEIDLLLTDVVMPNVDGPTLAASLLARRPDLPVLFMSGFSEGLDDELLVLSRRPLLAKPFGPDELLRAVREALEAVPA